MLKRHIMDALKEWNQRKNRKSLIISGARQVGKTYIVRAFANECYGSLIELNFLEQPELKEIFAGNLDTDTLLLNISVYRQTNKIIPGKTLIFLDEIQECPQAVASLKFWTMDGRYDVIASGSALSISYNNPSSYPVGYVDYFDMYALNFKEYLWANDIDERVIDALHECFLEKRPVPSAIHGRMMTLLQQYMVTGGMPEVVNALLLEKNISEADKVQRTIYRDYIADIAHMAPAAVKIKAEKCYRSIPLHLSGENHKFKYSTVASKGTASRFETSLDWIKGAFMVKEICNLKSIDYPPELYKDESNFRLYPTDIGMLIAACDPSIKKALLEEKQLEERSTNIVLGTAKGGLYEALAADFLIKNGHDQIYFYKNPKSTLEIEFFIMNDDGLIPIEIKAGKKKANSLHRILENDLIPYGYKMSSQNVGVVGKKITLPMYMLMFL